MTDDHARRSSRWEYVKAIFGGGPRALKEIVKNNVLFLLSLVVVIPTGSGVVTWVLSSDFPEWVGLLSSLLVILTTVAVAIGLIMAEVVWKVDREFGRHDE